MTIRARIKTKPAEQWKIGREYRRRLKKALMRNTSRFPFPPNVADGEDSPPFKVEVVAGLGSAKVTSALLLRWAAPSCQCSPFTQSEACFL